MLTPRIRWKPVGAITVVIVRLPREGLARGAKDTTGIKLSQSPRGEIKSEARRANRINPEKEQLATPGR